MNKKIFLALALLACSSAGFAAEKRTYELGFIAGEPTGLSGKMDLGGGRAVDAAAAWSFTGDKSLTLHADHLWYREGVFKVREGRLPLYYGVGGRLKLEDKSLLGARFPVGVQYFLEKTSVTFFGEIAPVLDLLPATVLRLNAAVGVRVRL